MGIHLNLNLCCNLHDHLEGRADANHRVVTLQVLQLVVPFLPRKDRLVEYSQPISLVYPDKGKMLMELSPGRLVQPHSVPKATLPYGVHVLELHLQIPAQTVALMHGGKQDLTIIHGKLLIVLRAMLNRLLDKNMMLIFKSICRPINHVTAR